MYYSNEDHLEKDSKNAIIYKEDVLWRKRVHSENDFEYFVRLHTDIKPALVYTLSNERSYLFTANLIAKIWARSVKIESKNCVYCGSIYEDYLVHYYLYLSHLE